MPQAIKSSITVEDYGPYLRFRKWQQSSKGYIYRQLNEFIIRLLQH